MNDIAARKTAARAAARQRRRAAADPERAARAARRLAATIAKAGPAVVAAYLPIGDEIDPLPALSTLGPETQLAMPVIVTADAPLIFRAWRPGDALRPGPFGTHEPATGAPLRPDLLVVPLLGFDRNGHRLGYGGGYYDRTLAALRGAGPALAIGFAFDGQEDPGALPHEATDAPLDMIVTESRVLRFG